MKFLCNIVLEKNYIRMEDKQVRENNTFPIMKDRLKRKHYSLISEKYLEKEKDCYLLIEN